ncbi:MAG: uracil-DNA glycosylase family protein [Gammaproteobacteria bacterium]
MITCERCSQPTCTKILRDIDENVPQPGFIGARFRQERVLLVGQNPAVPGPKRADKDRTYTAALRRVRDHPSIENWTKLQAVLLEFVPDWPIQRDYFPLEESGLTLPEIAYCNIVRCRTEGNAQPSKNMTSECADIHFARWLDLLEPRAIVFIGKWAHDQGSRYAQERQIPYDFMNRDRSLSDVKRMENRKRVATFVRSIVRK